MSITVALNHVTHYRYDRPIVVGMQTVRLRPAPHTRSHVRSYSLSVSPKEHFINWQQDPFGNYLARLVFPEKIRELRVEVDLISEIRIFNPFDFFLEDYAKDFPFRYEPSLMEELAPYLEVKENGPLLQQWLNGISMQKRGIVDFLVDINQQTNSKLGYLIRMEPGVQSCEQTLQNGSGSCRDMAWLLCQLLRLLGFATRFASGYLIQLKPDVKPLDGPAGTDKDFTDLHAWTEVYLPGAGWIGLDPTSGLFTGEGHIPLCSTPSPSSAAPISGTHEPCETTFEFHMDVTRIEEAPRVTRPFLCDDWQAIDALGAKVDEQLRKQDVRLTMGGEPTFVSDEDRVSNEWHFTALSENKKRLGNELFLKFKSQFAPGGVIQYTQGKWYPGEILPRWAMQCSWRLDNEPVWRNAALFADLEKPQKTDTKLPRVFLNALAQALGIPPDYVLIAYEKGGKEKGAVLPLHFSPRRKRWISNRWQFPKERMTLIAGDSPLGLRLPLSELPEVKDAKNEFYPERSAFEQVGPLPSYPDFLKMGAKRAKKAEAVFAKDPSGLIKTALCAEMRNGVLCLFLPPQALIEHFLELVATIEKIANEMEITLVLEGYPPPADLRMTQLSVTPDPGVIEVNVQPAASWEELKTITTAVYAQAKQTRLSAEKFLLDGRRVGTGGGNHIVVGAAAPQDSPFLRRPDLLRSMVSFWQNHPALSYLFSSMYIGPTSQSPRIDEARHDALYELEIAFRQLDNAQSDVPPWLVDRLFRNLLVDLTGNTHRTEFCIDKLYSPDSNRGRLGLLEMRGFEMTPHPQMNLAQALLIRACIAHFWKIPYKAPLIRWGTLLHDKFMLPHYIREDLHTALGELTAGGYRFAPEWFEPFFAFRFPHYGRTQVDSVTISLDMALEPWPVLGEEIAAGSVSRSVDSSIERLQVMVEGLVDARHLVTCNGRALPLHPTQQQGVRVAGIRYKAWAPPSCLHPTLPINTPLVFDVVDRQAKRSLGGCTYHVMHPGGRNYDTIPVNENEAEGRKLSRFEAMGHRPGRCKVPAAEYNPDFPHTLDLRLSV